MIYVGQKVRFDPFESIHGFGVADFRVEVVGTVVSVNYKHRWFLVQHGELRTSFNFCDIGDSVKICK